MIALLVANATYPDGKLEQVTKDVESVAAALEARGFDVRVHNDLDRTRFDNAFAAFTGDLEDGAVGVFYFAGHGVGGTDGDALLALDSKAIPLADLVRDMSRDEGTSAILIDASRKGALGTTAVPKGTHLIVSASPGSQVTHEGVFAAAFTAELGASDVFPTVFAGVKRRVEEKSGGEQVPWIAEPPKEMSESEKVFRKIERAIVSNHGIRSCVYEEGGRVGGPPFRRDVSFVLVQGRATEIEIVGDDTGSNAFRRCMRKAVEKLELPVVPRRDRWTYPIVVE